jgi:hypothetical protein
MTLLRVELLLGLAISMWLSGCASIGAPVPPSLELPKPPTDLRAARKADKVTLSWTIPERTTERQRVRYLGKTKICRSADTTGKTCDAVIGQAAAPANLAHERHSTAKKPAAEYIDTLPATLEQQYPTSFAAYAVEVLNTAGRGAGISNEVHVPLVPTVPPFTGFAGEVTAQGVRIDWQCPPVTGRRTSIKYLFRLYRRSQSDSKGIKIADIDSTSCVQGPSGLAPVNGGNANPADVSASEPEKVVTSFLDQGFEWEQTYFYRGTVVSVVDVSGKQAEVEGDDTPEVKVFAHDIFPPAVPTGLQAAFSGPGQQPFIDLIWAPVMDSDLEGYNVYRHEAGSVPVKLNAELVKTPAFRDMPVAPGKTYFYSVSAVDQRGNESGRSEETSESAGD